MEKVLCQAGESGVLNTRNSEGDIIEVSPGKLLFAYMGFYAGGGDADPAHVMARLSEDDGETWSEPFRLRANEASGNTGRLSFMRLGPRQCFQESVPPLLAMFYLNLNYGQPSELMMSVSADNGTTWTAGRPVRHNGNYVRDLTGCRNSTALRLRDGRIILPTYMGPGGLQMSFFLFSDDEGETWQRSRKDLAIPLRDEAGGIYGYSFFEEPTVAELRDGRLLCFGRTRIGQLYQSISTDRGVNWSEPVPTGLASSNSPAILKTIPGTDDLLCVWNQVSEQEILDHLGRMRISCAISRDDGKTWEKFKNLESLDDMGRVPVRADSLTADASSEKDAIAQRTHVRSLSTDTILHYPQEVIARYPRWPGYVHNEYPSVSFTSSGKVIFAYGVNDAETAGLPCGYKVNIKPISWLYE